MSCGILGEALCQINNEKKQKYLVDCFIGFQLVLAQSNFFMIAKVVGLLGIIFFHHKKNINILDKWFKWQAAKVSLPSSTYFYSKIILQIIISNYQIVISTTMEKISSFFGGLTASIEVQIKLDMKQNQKYHKIRQGKQKIKLPVYTKNDDISGTVEVKLKDGKKYEHLGIKCFLVGYLQIYSNKDLCTEFNSLSKELQPAGILTENKTYKFKFPNFEKEYETFNGIAGRVRYFIRVMVNKNYKMSTTKEYDFAVLLPDQEVEKTNQVVPMKMEVGIEDCLHIDFEYNKSFYHLKDIIVGRVNFHLVKIKIKSMEIALVRKETFGTGTTTKTETQTLVKYEVMDGCPDKGEFIPIRMYMKGIPLAPSYKNIHNRLSVKYWINLVLLDEDDRRYFKQTEVQIYRKP